MWGLSYPFNRNAILLPAAKQQTCDDAKRKTPSTTEGDAAKRNTPSTTEGDAAKRNTPSTMEGDTAKRNTPFTMVRNKGQSPATPTFTPDQIAKFQKRLEKCDIYEPSFMA